MEKLGVRNWVKLNNQIKKTNFTNVLEFYANTYNHEGKYTSYVWGKHIHYSANAISKLFDLHPSAVCGVRNRRDSRKIPSKEGWVVILEEL